MIETFFLRVVLLFLCSFYPPVFVASMFLLVTEELGLFAVIEGAMQSMVALVLPGITTFHMVTYTTVNMREGGLIPMGVILLILLLPLFFYLFAICGITRYLDPHRLNQTTSALLVVYALILLYAAMKLIGILFTSNIFLLLLIFGVSFVCFRKTKIPLFVIVGAALLLCILFW